MPRAHNASIRMGLDTICGLENFVGTVYGVPDFVVGLKKPAAKLSMYLHLTVRHLLNLLSCLKSPLSKSMD